MLIRKGHRAAALSIPSGNCRCNVGSHYSTRLTIQRGGGTTSVKCPWGTGSTTATLPADPGTTRRYYDPPLGDTGPSFLSRDDGCYSSSNFGIRSGSIRRYCSRSVGVVKWNTSYVVGAVPTARFFMCKCRRRYEYMKDDMANEILSD